MKKVINNGYIWKNGLGNWCRKCPKCNRIVQSKSGKTYVMASFNRNRACHLCKRIGFHHSKKTIEKIISSQKGRSFTEEHKKKLSNSQRKNKNHPWRDYKRPKSFGKLISKKLKGRVISNDWKMKMRIAKLKRFEELGISACEDKNSNKFFEKINKNGYEFNSTVFMDIGYVADGYDKNKHIWIEYDTPYHDKPKQKEKDLIRQNNIVQYFKNIKTPLKSFMRINVNKEGNILNYRCVFGKYIDFCI